MHFFDQRVARAAQDFRDRTWESIQDNRITQEAVAAALSVEQSTVTTDEHLALVMRELARSLDGVQTVIRQFSGVIESEREFYTTEEIAAKLKVHEDTVLADVRRGMPCYERGKSKTYLWPEVVAWVRKRYGSTKHYEEWHGAQGTRRVA